MNPANVPDQNPHAVAPVIKFESKPDQAFAIADLTAAYAGSVQQVERGIAMIHRKTVVVQDEITAKKPVELWWFLHTPAHVEISPDGSSARLTMHGKQLAAVIASPKTAKFEVLPAAPLPTSPNPRDQNPNPGIHKLAIHLHDVTDLRLTVYLTPLTADQSAPVGQTEIKTLADW